MTPTILISLCYLEDASCVLYLFFVSLNHLFQFVLFHSTDRWYIWKISQIYYSYLYHVYHYNGIFFISETNKIIIIKKKLFQFLNLRLFLVYFFLFDESQPTVTPPLNILLIFLHISLLVYTTSEICCHAGWRAGWLFSHLKNIRDDPIIQRYS